MPTARARHMITETDRLADALNIAADVWPEIRTERAELLRRIIDAGIESLEQDARQRAAERIATVRALKGSMTGTWPADWREDLRGEWPA